MTPELYKTIVAIVDERVKEIKVTREDFNELRKVVFELAKAQQELAQAQKRTEQRVEELARAQEELTKAQQETQRELRQLARAVGGLSDTIGYGLEDIARVVLPSYLKNHYSIEVKKFRRKVFPLNGRHVEIDLYAEGTKGEERVIVLGEAKSRIGVGNLKRFLRKTERVLPLLKRKAYRVMLGYYIHPNASELAEKEGVILVASYER